MPLPPNAIPTSWSELIEKSKSYLDEALGYATEDVPWLSSSPPRRIERLLHTPASWICRVAVLRGPAACLETLSRFAPHLPPTVAPIASDWDENQVEAVAALEFIEVARACGATVPAEAVRFENEAVTALSRLGNELFDKEREVMAFAALAIGAIDRLPAFLNGRPPTRFEPGRRFQLDVEQFLWYLAAAQKARAAPADVEPAWLDFIRNFPRKLGTRALDFTHVMIAARAYYAMIEGRPVERVAASVHALITGAEEAVDTTAARPSSSYATGSTPPPPTSARQVAISWTKTGDHDVPWQATKHGRTLQVRLGDFPAEPLYTLLVDGEAIESFDEWPTRWIRPETPNVQATSGAFTVPESGRPFRLFYESGVAAAPDNPFGNNILVISEGGAARLDHRDRNGSHRAWRGRIGPNTLARILDELRAARFPAGTPKSIPAGASTRALRLEVGGERAEVELPFHSVAKLVGYHEVFQLLDSVIAQLTEGELRVAPDLLDEPIVVDAARVT
jgi:hypothetical protein